MTLDKSIIHHKDHRQQYRKSQAFDRSCRCHGGCPWCERNRLHRDATRKYGADEQLREDLK